MSRTVVALIGFAGAQVLAIALFLLFAEPCDCFVPGQCGECLWGDTVGTFWAKYGLGASLLVSLVGYFSAEA